MRRLAAAFVLLAVSAPSALGQAPYSVRWGDAVSVVAAGIAFVIPEATKLPKAAPSCAPCDAASLPGVDRVALHTFSGSAGTASTDRKSTRLNSSHLVISYAVFCLKKKKDTNQL